MLYAMCQKQTSDVVDAVRLEQFKKKHEAWRSCLSGDDLHSIWRQQSSLLWDYALFLTINELRKDAGQNPLKGVGFNAPVLRLFDAGFAVIQVIGIRRLTEKQPKNLLKRIISLRALVDDVRENQQLLTREVYLGCRELPFDPGPAKKRFFDTVASSEQKFCYEGMDTRGSEAWAESESAHVRFDKLSKTSATSRSREDLVSPKWFDLLDSKISGCEDVCVFTDKFIAHAADPTSRTEKDADQIKVTLNRLGECHQAMLQVVDFIGGPLLQDSMGAGLPTPQFNDLENLDKAWMREDDLKQAREHWQRFADEIEKWKEASLI